jgi:aminoglycoside 6'-N-acetyltransferase
VPFAFRRMTEADLPVMCRWLNEPHVMEFYTREPRTLAGVTEHYIGRITGRDPTHPFIALAADTPIGYFQAYRLADYPDYAAALGAEPDAAGVDMLIGDPAYAHRGLGAPLLQRFLADVVWDLTGASVCWIGPSIHNTRAIRCYEKAGFVYQKTTHIPGEDDPEYVMRLSR